MRPAPTPTAERIRRCRQRKAQGKRRVVFEVDDSCLPACFQVKPSEIPVSFGIDGESVAKLVALGWLDDAQRADQQAVAQAVLKMASAALWASQAVI